MKELDSFTVEQLNDFIKSDHAQCGDIAALARIALAAKRAEGLPGNIYPDISGEITALEKILKWILNLEVPTTGATNRAILLGNTIELLRDCQKPIVATPHLNSPEIRKLILSEVSDFCAGLGQPGEPELPEDIQQALMNRIELVFNNCG